MIRERAHWQHIAQMVANWLFYIHNLLSISLRCFDEKTMAVRDHWPTWTIFIMKAYGEANVRFMEKVVRILSESHPDNL